MLLEEAHERSISQEETATVTPPPSEPSVPPRRPAAIRPAFHNPASLASPTRPPVRGDGKDTPESPPKAVYGHPGAITGHLREGVTPPDVDTSPPAGDTAPKPALPDRIVVGEYPGARPMLRHPLTSFLRKIEKATGVSASSDRHACPECGKITLHTPFRVIGGVQYYTPRFCDHETAARKARYEAMLERDRQFLAEKLLGQSAIAGRRHRQQTFATFTTDDLPWRMETHRMAVAFTESHLAMPTWGVLVLSSNGPGRGKTHLATACCREFIEHGHPSDIITVPDWQDELKDSWSRNATETQAKIMDRYGALRLLALDDWGTERRGEWSESVLFQLVNDRYERELPLVITTNLEAGDFWERLGRRLSSRVRECVTWVDMVGEDYRAILSRTRRSARQDRS